MKTFHVNTIMYPDQGDIYYYVDQTKPIQVLINHIKNGQYIRMFGPRASGKSSRVMLAKKVLESLGYTCL